MENIDQLKEAVYTCLNLATKRGAFELSEIEQLVLPTLSMVNSLQFVNNEEK